MFLSPVFEIEIHTCHTCQRRVTSTRTVELERRGWPAAIVTEDTAADSVDSHLRPGLTYDDENHGLMENLEISVLRALGFKLVARRLEPECRVSRGVAVGLVGSIASAFPTLTFRP